MTPGDSEAQPSAEITELLDTIKQREKRARWRSVILVAIPAIVVAILVTFAVRRLRETNEQVQAAVTGGPAAVDAAVRPDRIDFGTVPFGSSSSEAVEVTNTGKVDLKPTSISTPFLFVGIHYDTCSGAVISPGRSCSFSVQLSAVKRGDFESLVAVRYLGGEGIKTVAVKGTVQGSVSTPSAPETTGSPPTTASGTTSTTAIPVRLDGFPAAIRFDAQAVGTSSFPQNLTVMNRGSKPVRFVGVAMAGIAPSDFAVFLGSCAQGPLANGTNCRLSVLFRPTIEGQRGAVLKIIFDGAGPLEVQLSGLGRSG